MSKTSMCSGFVALLFATTAIAAGSLGPDLPDPALTPGEIDPAVTQDNIHQTICVAGYTARVRPPTSFTDAMKIAQLADPRRNYVDKNPADYEEDHLISLELGGHPRSYENLWPEHWADPNGARTKDTVERELRRRVCLPKNDPDWISLSTAQRAIATNWIAAGSQYLRPRHRTN